MKRWLTKLFLSSMNKHMSLENTEPRQLAITDITINIVPLLYVEAYGIVSSFTREKLLHQWNYHDTKFCPSSRYSYTAVTSFPFCNSMKCILCFCDYHAACKLY